MRGFDRIDEGNLLRIILETRVLVELETNSEDFRDSG